MLEIKKDVDYSMPFLKNIVPYTEKVLFGDHDCIFCKEYLDYLLSLSVTKKRKWRNYFVNLRKLFNKCFQCYVFCKYNWVCSPVFQTDK